MAERHRIEWVDHAKGLCIILVVMMHSVLGTEAAAGATGWMHGLVAFAAPFRMPDFFLISGLFLARVLDRDWRLYLDRKVVHFAYFYSLWLTIQFGFKAPLFAAEAGWASVPAGYLIGFVQPFGTLWFIYLLAIFFVVAKLLHQVRVPWQAVLAAAAALEIAPIETGSVIVDEFCARFVYFYAGALFAPRLFALADWADAHRATALAGLLAWATVNGAAVLAGVPALPVVSLALGTLGAIAVVLLGSLLARLPGTDWLAALGRTSIVVYLAFFLPMAVTRILLLKLDLVDVGTASLVVTLAGVSGPMIAWWIVRRTGFARFLFVRPAWARLEGTHRASRAPQAAE
ncbi:acyltransferase family protein [Polymorphum gilvum]|uniref:Acyltransferase 3 n=1 Tax=Polymorphum gilvum (strain LMG 25793 / CGMCC 1.9160 / SL003B-26A1) TaxID=991905 RepID=F2IVF4_POLGS|nr:acyltransferase family protein [Polymorphum gilvum]ADZ72672.1 Acyltransferase 3 [Polymorphum gilvum SL003B-26A1]